MPRKVLPRLTAVVPGSKGFCLKLRWDTGKEGVVDIGQIVERFRVYEPLRRSPKLFRKVHLGEHGTDVVWSEEIDMSADTLWRLAQEQSGATMTAESFHAWRARNGYTLEEAARALGISRRMIAYYEQGEKPIPRVVALATRALEAA
jgi:DNA-binding transcriptional regulator YiaG